MRNGEIEAISTALKVLGDRVTPADAEANKRAFEDQAKRIEALGGIDKILASEEFDHTPVPGTP